MLTALLSGAGLGLLSVPHCAAMCGPLAQAACARSGERAAPLHYQAGRVVGYAFLGTLSGHFGRALSTLHIADWLPLLLATTTSLVLMLLAWRLWPRTASQRSRPITLRTTPKQASWWTRLQRLLPVHAGVFGLSTALLPCGALAAALLVAAHHADPTLSALSMVGFALASAPGTLVVAWLLQRLPQLRSPRVMKTASLLLMLAATLLIARPLYRFTAHQLAGQPLHTEAPSCH